LATKPSTGAGSSEAG